MNRNVANWDRILRAIAGAAMIAAGVTLSLPLVVRVLALGMTGGYLVLTSLAGTCLGYKMTGMTTCPVHAKGEGA